MPVTLLSHTGCALRRRSVNTVQRQGAICKKTTKNILKLANEYKEITALTL